MFYGFGKIPINNHITSNIITKFGMICLLENATYDTYILL